MLRKILTIGLLFCLSVSCDEDFTSTIPNAEVNLTLDLISTDALLMGSLAFKEYTAPRLKTELLGYGGLLVINGIGENPIVNLYAYDLACPNEAQPNVKVKPGDTGLATCPKCGAVYRIAWGGDPESGSKFWLRRYNVVQEPGQNSESATRFRVIN